MGKFSEIGPEQDWRKYNLRVNVANSAQSLGRPSINLASLTLGEGLKVTAVMAAGNNAEHGLIDGDLVTISGTTQPEYSGDWIVDSVSGTTFTYNINAYTTAPASPATGATILAQPQSFFKRALIKNHVDNAGTSVTFGPNTDADFDDLSLMLEYLIEPTPPAKADLSKWYMKSAAVGTKVQVLYAIALAFLVSLFLCPAAVQAQPYFPSTPYSRGLMTQTTAAAARTYLGISAVAAGPAWGEFNTTQFATNNSIINFITGALVTNLVDVGTLTVNGGTRTAATNALTIAYTNNAAGVTFDGLVIDAVETASAAGTRAFNVKVANASVMNIRKSGAVYSTDGSAALPSFSFVNDATTGVYYAPEGGGSYLVFSRASTPAIALQNSELRISSAWPINWGGTVGAFSSGDVGIVRKAAGVLVVFDGVTQTAYRDIFLRQLQADSTVTAAGTTTPQTINKSSGSINFAAGDVTKLVTCNLASTASQIFVTVQTDDATATIKNCVAAAGSFTIKLTAAATAETKVSFFIVNP